MVVLASCGSDRGNSDTVVKKELKAETKLFNSSYNGVVRIKKSDISDADFQRTRNEYMENDLVQLAIHPNYNVSILKINNMKEYKNTVFIAPKIYVYGGKDKARISPKLNSSGTVTLDFPVILTSGLKKEIASPSGDERIILPDTMQVKNEFQLRGELSQRFGREQNLSVLPGCPKRIYIKYSNVEFDATPSDFLNGDYCDLDRPFTVSVTLEKSEARYLLEVALYNNSVDIRVELETRARLTVSKFEMSFEKSKIFKELESVLKIKS
jgi:hypothetical protein